MRQSLFLSSLIWVVLCLQPSQLAAVDLYSWTNCTGSAKPYPVPDSVVAYPDSLTPVMVNHVSRHGARFASSAKRSDYLMKVMRDAESRGTITPLGQEALSLVERINEVTNDRWGQLDSLGMAEQEGIASRLCESLNNLFDTDSCSVSAIASYVPRCVMSMYEFTHEISLKHPRHECEALSGPVFSPLLRPFDIDSAYISYRENRPYEAALDAYVDSVVPVEIAGRLLGDYFSDDRQSVKFALTFFECISGLEAMGLEPAMSKFMSLEECNRFWRCRNLTQYLERTANMYSDAPSEIAKPLVADIVRTTDAFIDGKLPYRAVLRFAHAETMMPLLSLLKIPGCYFMTDNLAEVAEEWHNFYVVPMASNLQLKLFRSKSGNYYVRFDFNEVPVKVLPGSDTVYQPWEDVRAYMLNL